MKTLKIKSETFLYEKVADSEYKDIYTYSLYDINGDLIAFEIGTFKGVREIAKAFLTGNREELDLAILGNCY